MFSFLKRNGASMIGKLMGLATIGTSLANITLLQRYLEGVMGVIALTILSAMMTGMLVISGFYGIYVGLTRYGLDPDVALATVAALGCLLTAGMSALTLLRLRELRDLPPPTRGIPHISRIGDVAHAFFSGFKVRPSNMRN